MAAGTGTASKTTADLKLLEKLVTSLLEAHNGPAAGDGQAGRSGGEGLHRAGSVLGRFRPMSRSFRTTSSLRRRNEGPPSTASGAAAGGAGAPGGEGTMPTIQESGTDQQRGSWNPTGAGGNVRRVLNSIANAPHRFSQSLGGPLQSDADDEERSNLTQNIL
uniref:Uncharacterized protein n=1 Tax=Anopheles dirus TaxID=7168 RepID=A0A182NBV5_9DIPT